MRVAKFSRGRFEGQGLIVGSELRVLASWESTSLLIHPFTLPSLSPEALQAADPIERIPLNCVQLLPPVDALARIVCIGINYEAHAAEAGRDLPSQPSVFLRTMDSIRGHGQSLIRPRASKQFDFEGEIAVVIGKPGHRISRDDAISHVFGYTCFMDGSLRDFQKQSLIAGKNFWRSGAMGPSIVTADEVPDWRALELMTQLSGETMQHATADMMIYDIPTIISYISSWMPLKAGDVIATGTPSGTGFSREPQRWMRAGDTIEVRITGVGTLENVVEDER